MRTSKGAPVPPGSAYAKYRIFSQSGLDYIIIIIAIMVMKKKDMNTFIMVILIISTASCVSGLRELLRTSK